MKERTYSPEQLREQLSGALEEPEVVTMKMKEAYETIRANEDGKNKKSRRAYPRAAGVAAAAAIALIAATPVMAKGIGKAWDAVTAAMFGADEKVQETYEGTGLTQTFETPQERADAEKSDSGKSNTEMPDAKKALPSQTVGGMTVSLKQVLTDGYMLYLSVDVEAPEGIKIDGSSVFDRMRLLEDGKPCEFGGTYGINSSFVEDEYAVADNHRAYEVVCNADKGIRLDGKHLTLELTDFLTDRGKQDFETAIEGTWTLDWDMGEGYHGKTLTVDLTGGSSGAHAALKSVEITPLSYSLYFDYDGTDMDLFDDSLWVEFVTKDGQILNERGNQASLVVGNGGVTGKDEETGLYCSRESFAKILDLDELAGVRIDGVTYPVK